MRVDSRKSCGQAQPIWPYIHAAPLKLYQGQTKQGHSVVFWKAPAVSAKEKFQLAKKGFDPSYACHGFTVGSHKLAGGPYTPYANGIDIILADEYRFVSSSELIEGDLLCWRDEDGDISHTARVVKIYRDTSGDLQDTTRLATKNGGCVLREFMRLSTLKIKYGSDISFYRELSEPEPTLLPR